LKHRRFEAGRFALTGMAIATACLWGLDANALGLGRLSVQSALGEALRAEIDVTALTAEEASTLRLRVAAPDAYRAAGVDYNAVLPDTQVQLMRRPGGQPYLKLSSSRAVVEPFVDVILEMDWASGRLVREYTMLFDPPVTRTAQATPAPAAVAPVISPAPAMPAAAAPAAPRPSAAAPAAPAAPVVAAPRPVPAERPPTPQAAAPAPKPAAPPAPAASRATPDDYLVRNGDTLSGIALRTQRPNVSLDQMLVALFRGNPEAFSGNNMNRLKAGAVLAVPSADAALQTADPAAREMIRAQSADFAAYRQQLASGVTTAKTDEPSRQAKGSVQASVQDSKQAAAPAPDKLTLSHGGVKASAPEARLSQEAEKKDATTRMAELNRNVGELKRLQGETVGAAASAPAAAAVAAAPTLASAPALSLPAASSVVVAAAPVPVPAAPLAQAPVAAPVAAPAAQPAAKAPQREEPGMLESMFENPLVLPGAGVLLALLAGFGIYRLRGRLRKDAGETSFLESRLQPDSFFGASGGQRIDTRDAAASSSSSMSYSLSQLDAIGDVDPVAEADVYLAYGRDLQAEEILKEAMRSNPERLAIRSKLLEVYAKRRDTKGFELLAGQLFAQSNGTGEEWTKAQELGRQIDPQNPLYEPGGEPDLIVREGGRVVEVLDATTMPQSVMPSAPPVGPIAGPESLDLPPGLDLDLDFAVSGKAPLDMPVGAAETTRPFTTGASIVDAQARAGADEHAYSLDDIDAPPGFLPAPASAGPSTGAGALDFDLGELSLDDGAATRQQAPAAAPGATPVVPDDEFASSLPAFEISDFDQDPLARKLELAEEFRQIGDMEGARDLLEEVISSADGSLKTKAQGMLDSLS
jgi:pilus assembly protein FimV